MTAPRVRADYDQLGQIASQFGAQADSTKATLSRLRQQMDVLQGGDWVGKGARAFYAEMDQQVLPTVNRLVNALQAAQRVTRQISGIMKNAEDGAAACFRLEGSGAMAGAAAAVAAAGEALGGLFGGSGAGGVLGGLFGGGGLSEAVSGLVSAGQGLLGRALDGLGRGLGVISYGPIGALVDVVGDKLGLGPIATDFARGVIDEASDMVGGLITMATQSPEQVVRNLVHAVVNYDQTWEALKKPYVEAWESGHPARAIGRGALAIGSLFVGGEVGEVGKGASIAGRAGELGRLAEAERLAELGRLGEAERLAEVGQLGREARVLDEAAQVSREARAVDDAAQVSREARAVDGAGAASRDFTVVDGYTLNREGYRLGQIEMPTAATPQMLGQAVEGPIREMVAERYGFQLPSKPPSATGPDVIVPAAERARVGFDIADVKPLNEAGIRKFWDQLDAWRDEGWAGGPRGTGPGSPAIREGRAALFGYDSQGNVYLVGIWDM